VKKIAIVGYSGSGKSTLAKAIANHCQYPLLHLDTVHFIENWQRRDIEDARHIVNNFLNQEAWVIEGNYQKLKSERRFKEADLIIFTALNRFTCFKNALIRMLKNHKQQRDDLAFGCHDRLNPSFIWWLLVEGRNRQNKAFYQRLEKSYPNKFITLKTAKEIADFISSLN